MSTLKFDSSNQKSSLRDEYLEDDTIQCDSKNDINVNIGPSIINVPIRNKSTDSRDNSFSNFYKEQNSL
jgi:hypothetical protein